MPTEYANYKVEAGELKMDFVVNNWKWNVDTIKLLLLKLEEHGIIVPRNRSRLALWINLASINITRLYIAQTYPEEIESMSTASHMIVENRRVSIGPNNTLTREERPILVRKRRHESIKLRFATQTQTLAGFFKFVASANIIDPIIGEIEPKNVTAAYIEAGAHMRLFIGYPYFGNSTLEHDPSLGIEVIIPFVTPELLAALLGTVSIVTAVVLVAKWKRKIVNVVG